MLKEIVNGVEVQVAADKEIEIKAEWAAYDSAMVQKKKTEYLDKRKQNYPSVNDLIDYLYASMKSNEIPECKALVSAIDDLTTKYPEPV